LYERYEGRWSGLVAWLVQTPNLNPLDFFLWGYMKSRVYHGGKPEARHQIVEAIESAVDIKMN
jgi:hypothetical protein